MSLDATEVRLTRLGSLELREGGEVYLRGWQGCTGCSCRDVAILALASAIEMHNEEGWQRETG
jgi:hypothetical protein